jgi:hypothetical protein
VLSKEEEQLRERMKWLKEVNGLKKDTERFYSSYSEADEWLN